jgi:hypothetical protein
LGKGPVELRTEWRSKRGASNAAVYVTDEADVAYMPFGIDLLPRLTRLCDSVRWELEQEHDAVVRDFDRWPEFKPGTTVYQCLQRLSLEGTRSACERLATLSDEDVALLAELRVRENKRRSDDPGARAVALRHTIRRINDVAGRWTTAATALSDDEVNGLRTADIAVREAVEASALAETEAFSEAPIGGIGSPAWHALWRAARAFAEFAQPSQPFPPQPDGVCVLCLQPASDDAALRLEKFDLFVRSRLQQAVDTAQDQVTKRRFTISGLVLDGVADEAVLNELETLHAPTALAVSNGITALHARRQHLLDGGYDEAGGIDLPDPNTQLKDLAARLEADAKAFEAAAQPSEVKALEESLHELEARELLGQMLGRVDAQIKREKQASRLRDAVASANTMLITKFSKELLEDAVTTPLADAFAEQCESLHLQHIPMTLEGVRGEKGNAMHQLALHHQNDRAVSTEDVLSEGEHRSVALAAFLAEVTVQDSASTIVFDDPVSSLDHGRRTYVAHEFGRMARRRPTVVFTHDLVFLWLLQNMAEKEDIPCRYLTIRRTTKAAGNVGTEPPWDGLNVNRRIGIMKEGLVKLKKMAESNPDIYEPQIRLMYGRLRDSWERAVEEVLLQGAIKRFSPEIKTQSLRKLHRLTDEHLTALESGMTKASAWVQGHDHAPDLGAVTPTLEEALADVVALESWVREIRKLYE